MVPLPSTSAWKPDSRDCKIKRTGKLVIQYHAALKILSISSALLHKKRYNFIWKLRESTKNYILTASINCRTSDSDILLPSLGRPAFNSSKVIVPLLSVSMDLNISFKPIISSSERFSAITCNKWNRYEMLFY